MYFYRPVPLQLSFASSTLLLTVAMLHKALWFEVTLGLPFSLFSQAGKNHSISWKQPWIFWLLLAYLEFSWHVFLMFNFFCIFGHLFKLKGEQSTPSQTTARNINNHLHTHRKHLTTEPPKERNCHLISTVVSYLQSLQRCIDEAAKGCKERQVSWKHPAADSLPHDWHADDTTCQASFPCLHPQAGTLLAHGIDAFAN